MKLVGLLWEIEDSSDQSDHSICYKYILNIHIAKAHDPVHSMYFKDRFNYEYFTCDLVTPHIMLVLLIAELQTI